MTRTLACQHDKPVYQNNSSLCQNNIQKGVIYAYIIMRTKNSTLVSTKPRNQVSSLKVVL